MRSVLEADIISWCRRNDWVESQKAIVRDFPENTFRRAIIPEGSAKQGVLALELSHWMPNGETLLWVTDWAHYIPFQMRIFHALFLRDPTRKLIEYPGFILEDTDADLTEALFCVLAFGWEAWCFSATCGQGIRIGDGIIIGLTPEGPREKVDAFEEILERLELALL